MAASSASGNSSQSKSLLWMMIGFFTGLLILVGGGFLLVNRVVRSYGLSAGSSNKNTVHTPGGSFRLQKQDQVGPGLPVYPRASLELPDGSDTATTIKEAQNGVTVSTYHATDIRDFVDNWYSQHLSPEFKRRDSGEKPLPEIFKDVNVSDSDIAFVAERGSQVRIVALSIDEGGTKISLIRVDKSPAPTSSSPTDN
jgi:hypothetical protein